MARYCGHCGTRLDDDARVCGNCGTPLSGATSYISDVKFADPEKKKKTHGKFKKVIKLCVGLTILVLAVVITINVVTAFTGYNGLLRKVMEAYKDYDIDTLVSVSSDLNFYESEESAESYFKDTVGYTLDAFETSVGHSYKLSYKVDESYTLSKRKYESMMERISRLYSQFDTSIIEKIVVAEVTVTAQQGKKSVSKTLEITMTKENGQWRLLYIV